MAELQDLEWNLMLISSMTLIMMHISIPKGFPGIPEGWGVSEETKQGLFAHRFRKNGGGHRLLIVFHGMGEHGGRYAHVPHYVQSSIDEVLCPDWRGHGQSAGGRGHISRFDDFIEDAAALIRVEAARLQQEYGKVEIHLLAHSLGGHLITRLLFLYPDLPLCSVTLSAPFLKVKQAVPAIKLFAAKVLSFLAPSLPLDTGLLLEQLSHDPEVLKTFREDRLNHSKMTPGFFTVMNLAWGDTLARHSGIQVPLQVFFPGDDAIVDEDFGRAFYEGLDLPKDKRFQVYPALYHEPLNDIGKDRVFGDLLSWITTHSI